MISSDCSVRVLFFSPFHPPFFSSILGEKLAIPMIERSRFGQPQSSRLFVSCRPGHGTLQHRRPSPCFGFLFHNDLLSVLSLRSPPFFFIEMS